MEVYCSLASTFLNSSETKRYFAHLGFFKVQIRIIEKIFDDHHVVDDTLKLKQNASEYVNEIRKRECVFTSPFDVKIGGTDVLTIPRHKYDVFYFNKKAVFNVLETFSPVFTKICTDNRMCEHFVGNVDKWKKRIPLLIGATQDTNALLKLVPSFSPKK